MSEIVLSVEEAEATPCDWNGHRLMKHQWWDTSDGHQRCANCKHVRTKPAEPVAVPQAPKTGISDAEPFGAEEYYQRLYAGVPKNYTDWIEFADNYANYKVAALGGKRA